MKGGIVGTSRLIFGREPVLIVSALAAIAQGAMMLWTNDSTITQPDMGWLVPIMTILGGWMGRQRVVPVEKIRDAGFSPSAIDARADDPDVPRNEGR